MKVIEHLDKAKNPLISFEIIPPPRGKSVQDIVDIVKAVGPYNPSWIAVTSHSSSAYYNEVENGLLKRRTYKKRPGTIGICGIIQNRFKIDTIAHILCSGFTKEETEDALIELNFLGIDNVLALRGDTPNYEKSVSKDRSVNIHASDLVQQISNLKNGIYMDELVDATPLDICVGVAGYPEKHFEAPSLKEDIKFLKKKLDAGADYVTTQMFFDNSKYLSFIKKCQDGGISAPIIPGLKVLKDAKQLQTIPSNFHIDFPDALVEEVTANPQHVEDIGVEWCVKQCQELLEKNVPTLHFYIMNDTQQVLKVIGKLRL